MMSVQHWQVQPVTVGFLVEDRVAVAAGATPVPAHGDNAAASCVSSNDADGDGGSSPDSRGDTGDCDVPETILGELERGKEECSTSESCDPPGWDREAGHSPGSSGEAGSGDCGVPEIV